MVKTKRGGLVLDSCTSSISGRAVQRNHFFTGFRRRSGVFAGIFTKNYFLNSLGLSGKKGDSAWLSWILLVSFSVGLGVFMFKWMTGFTQSSTQQIASRVEQSDCTSIGISILEACQTPEELRLTLVNKKSLNVDQILINYVDIYDNPGTKVINFSLRVNKPEKLSVLKQGITKQFELIPKAITQDKIIVCNDNSVVMSNIKQCS